MNLILFVLHYLLRERKKMVAKSNRIILTRLAQYSHYLESLFYIIWKKKIVGVIFSFQLLTLFEHLKATFTLKHQAPLRAKEKPITGSSNKSWLNILVCVNLRRVCTQEWLAKPENARESQKFRIFSKFRPRYTIHHPA